MIMKHPVKTFIGGLLFISILLLIAHIAVIFLNDYFPGDENTLALLDRFNLDAEVGIGTWFAQSQLLLVGMLAVTIGYFEKVRASVDARFWFAIALVFTYISIDEGSALHELLAVPARQILSISDGPLIFAWVVPMGIVVLLLTLIFARFLFRLNPILRDRLILAAFVFIGGAIGMEIIAGTYWSSHNFAFDKTYSFLTAIEETLENFGVLIALHALGDHLVKSISRNTYSLVKLKNTLKRTAGS